MAAQLILPPATPIFDNGVVESGARMRVYESGTTTPVTVYTDSALTTAASNPVVANSDGVLPDIYWDNDTSIRVVIEDSNGTTISDTDPYIVGGGSGSSGSGEWVSVFDYMSAAQITAIQAYTTSEDVTTELQAAIDATHAANKNLFLPAGRYNISATLDYPGTQDERNQSWTMLGTGFGELFARPFNAGTIIATATNIPMFRTNPTVAAQGVGGFRLEKLRFEQTSASATQPVIKLETLLDAKLIGVGVFQAGTGNGIEVDFCPFGEITDCRVMTSLWPAGSDLSSSTNTGIWVRNVIDGGLMTLKRITSRGWDWAYKIGDASGQPSDAAMISTHMRDCEVSYCNNGIWIFPFSESTLIENTYIEGATGASDGVGILDEGRWSTIINTQMFPAYKRGIHSKGTRGAVYIGNTISIGTSAEAAPDPIGYDLDGVSSGVTIFGGRVIVNNSSGNVNNAKAVKISGANPYVVIHGLTTEPAGEWTWTGADRIDTSAVTGTLYGNVISNKGFFSLPIHIGGVSFPALSDTLTEANVTSNILTLPPGTFFRFSPTTATTVNGFSSPTGQTLGRFIIIQVNANATIADTAEISLVGNRSFSGDGNVLVLFNIGGNITTGTWREIARYSADGIASAAKIAAVADLAGGADLATTVAKVNELLAAMRTSGSLTT